MKPTWNAISREGQKIYSLTLDTLGLYARSVEDIELLASVFGIHDDVEPLANFGVEGSKFALVKTMVWPQAGPGTVAAMEKAVKLLKAHGAAVDELELPDEFHELPSLHGTLMRGQGRPAFLPDYTTAKEQMDESLVETVENVDKLTNKGFLRAYDSISALRPKFDEIASQYAAVLAPSVVDEAPVGIGNTGSASFNGIWTVIVHTTSSE